MPLIYFPSRFNNQDYGFSNLRLCIYYEVPVLRFDDHLFLSFYIWKNTSILSRFDFRSFIIIIIHTIDNSQLPLYHFEQSHFVNWTRLFFSIQMICTYFTQWYRIWLSSLQRLYARTHFASSIRSFIELIFQINLSDGWFNEKVRFAWF